MFFCAVLAVLGGPAPAQVFLNEIFENPPGRGTAEIGWEYLELYGRPGQSLDGCFVLVLKGGQDADRDGVPEVEPQIDEVYDLTGARLGENGFFTLVGNRADGESPIAERFFAANPDFDPRLPESAGNMRWSDAMSFQAAMGGGSQVSRLDNHGSSTYLLAHVRPEDRAMMAQLRGVEHDTDFDGRIDAVVRTEAGEVPFPVLQVLDEVAWSNRAGREYLLFNQHELSESHGLNPDALSRLFYFPSPPARGHRTRDKVSSDRRVTGFEVRPTSAADESFVYGVLDSTVFPARLEYFDGYDFEGWPQLKGPTDPNARPYAVTDVDPEPDDAPFPGIVARPSNAGVLLDDLDLGGFGLTPGSFNDLSGGRGGSGVWQFRLVPGDLNMDGVVDQQDLMIADALMGADINELVEDSESPAGVRFAWQGPALQQLMLWLEPDALGAGRVAGEEDLIRLQELVAKRGDSAAARP